MSSSRDSKFKTSFQEFITLHRDSNNLENFLKNNEHTIENTTKNKNSNTHLYHLSMRFYSNPFMDIFNAYYERYTFEYLDSKGDTQYSYVKLLYAQDSGSNVIYNIEVKYQPRGKFPFQIQDSSSTIETRFQHTEREQTEREVHLLQIIEKQQEREVYLLQIIEKQQKSLSEMQLQIREAHTSLHIAEMNMLNSNIIYIKSTEKRIAEIQRLNMIQQEIMMNKIHKMTIECGKPLDNCTVCYSTINDINLVVPGNCFHIICRDCFVQCDKCPICRSSYIKSQIVKVIGEIESSLENTKHLTLSSLENVES